MKSYRLDYGSTRFVVKILRLISEKKINLLTTRSFGTAGNGREEAGGGESTIAVERMD